MAAGAAERVPNPENGIAVWRGPLQGVRLRSPPFCLRPGETGFVNRDLLRNAERMNGRVLWEIGS